MPLLLVGLGGLGVPSLVVLDDVAGVPRFGHTAPAPERHVAPLVQRPAHLLGRHLWVFPPEVAPCVWRRIRARSRPGSGAASTRCRSGPRSPSDPLPA